MKDGYRASPSRGEVVVRWNGEDNTIEFYSPAGKTWHAVSPAEVKAICRAWHTVTHSKLRIEEAESAR